jgi:hypothetical protein
VARFFAQLAPNAKRSVLSVASRREMVRRQWRNPHASLEGHYGLGIMSGTMAGWDWFGHTGGFQGCLADLRNPRLRFDAFTILTTPSDGWAWILGRRRHAHITRS